MFSKKLFIFLEIFVILNVALYLFIIFFNNRIPFSSNDYFNNSHHYLEDTRISGKSFNLLNALGQEDAQWYLKIAVDGYPKAKGIDLLQNHTMGNLTYAFFPLYPLLLWTSNIFLQNIELTAFVLANLLMIANFASLYYVISKLYGSNTALKTIFMLFAFPFSIFYRSYFTEGLFLFFLIWFSYFLIKKKFLAAGILEGLLIVTRPSGFFILFPLLYFLLKSRKKVKIKKIIISIALSLIPVSIWLYLNFVQTGNLLHFYEVQRSWSSESTFHLHLSDNVKQIENFFILPFHSFHASQVEVVTVISGLIILMFSRKKILPELWWISVFLFALPLIIKDTMAFSRYQIVVFPLFLYLSLVLKRWAYICFNSFSYSTFFNLTLLCELVLGRVGDIIFL